MAEKQNAVTPLKVIQNEVNPVGPEVMAKAIIVIAEAMKVIDTSRLKREVIVTLIHDQSKIAKRDIRIVLNNLRDLERDYVNLKDR